MSDEEEQHVWPVITIACSDYEATGSKPDKKTSPNKCIILIMHDLSTSTARGTNMIAKKSNSSVAIPYEIDHFTKLETTGCQNPPLEALSGHSVVGPNFWFQPNTRDIEHEERKKDTVSTKHHCLSQKALLIICGLMLAAVATVIGVSRHFFSSTEGENTKFGNNPSPEINTQRNIEVLSYDAIIVGAGWAGLKAADTLLSSGVSSILLLEATDFIGGRSKTNNDLIPNVPIDLGSEWLYTGLNSTTMAEVLLDDLGLGFNQSTDFSVYSQVVFSESVSNGVIVTKRLNASEMEGRFDRLWFGKDGFVGFAQQLSKKLSKEDTDKAFGDALTDFEDENSIQNEDQQLLNMFMDEEIEIEYAGEQTDLSLEAINHYSSKREMKYFSVPGAGFGNAAQSFADPFYSKIKLNAKVIEINYEDDGNVMVSYFENGVVSHANSRTALVTVPLGVLKAGTISFTPNLPQDKQDVISNMGFGSLNKCIMYWEDPNDVVWPKDKKWIYLATPDDESSGTWTNFMNSLDTKGVPVLVSFIGGDESVAMEEQTDEEVLDDVMKNLLSMFPTIARPDKFIITRWGKDEAFGGAYAFAKVGQNFAADAEVLCERTGSLWFAGEATNVEGWHATTVGAWNTGEVTATSMVSTLKKQRG